ncbi:MAG: hypothetical protein ACI9JM_002055 [Halioglobus sp.]|jgi:hypothetical protein
MTAEIAQFFDRFAADFTLFDGPLIATRYATPYTAVSNEGDIKFFGDSAAIGRYFQLLLDDYGAQNITLCRYHSLHSEAISDVCSLATVHWEMLSQAGELVTDWRESYTLLMTDAGLKIFTSMDH